jgi:FkbM family methyltransferase
MLEKNSKVILGDLLVSTARKLGRLVSVFLPSGTVLPILRGPLAGQKWVAGAAAGNGKGLSSIFNLGEPEQFAFVEDLKFLLRGNVCFDIGANVGLYSLLFSKYSDQVYAFEPLPRNLKFLYEILKLNNARNVKIIPCAVSDKFQLSRFSEGGNCAIGKLSDAGEQLVLAISCDDFVSAYNVAPKLMKIDVEGAEVLVLRGSEMLIREHHPIILLSTHSESLKTECLDLLRDFGYNSIKPLNHGYIEKASEFAIFSDDLDGLFENKSN